MKQLTEPERKSGSDAWGRPATWFEQRFEIEASDIGTKRDHYLGHNHQSFTFGRSEVGKTIVVYTSPGWTCWTFGT